MRRRFLIQKMAQNDPEKKMPSTAANATKRSAKLASSEEIHLSAHSPFVFFLFFFSQKQNKPCF